MSWSADYKVHQLYNLPVYVPPVCTPAFVTVFRSHCSKMCQIEDLNLKTWTEQLGWEGVGGINRNVLQHVASCDAHTSTCEKWDSEKKKSRVSTAIPWMKKFVAHLYKLLHFVSLDLYFIFLADVHAVRLLQEQPFICDVWFGFRVLRRTPNTLRMCVSSVTHVWT